MTAETTADTGVAGMRRIGVLLGHLDAMRKIGDLITEELGGDFETDAPRLRRGLAHGVPVPVLAVSGANGLEPLWTQFLAFMLDPRASREVGSLIGPAIFHHLTGHEVVAEQLVVMSEVGLGAACLACGHGSVIDLVLIGPTAILAVEQKVTSSEGTWTCNDGTVHRQLAEYAKLLPAWALREHQRHFPGRSDPFLERRFLTVGGGLNAEWRAVTHAELSVVVAAQLPSAIGRMTRHALLAMLFDWNAHPFGDWPQEVERLRALLASAGADPRPTHLLAYANFARTHAPLRAVLLTLSEEP